MYEILDVRNNTWTPLSENQFLVLCNVFSGIKEWVLTNPKDGDILTIGRMKIRRGIIGYVA